MTCAAEGQRKQGAQLYNEVWDRLMDESSLYSACNMYQSMSILCLGTKSYVCLVSDDVYMSMCVRVCTDCMV